MWVCVLLCEQSLWMGDAPCSTGWRTPIGISLTPALSGQVTSSSTLKALNLGRIGSTISCQMARLSTAEALAYRRITLLGSKCC